MWPSMMFTSVKLQLPLPPPPSPMGRPNDSQLAKMDFQARINMKQAKLIANISRRDAMFSMSAAVLANFFAAEAAEARRVKPETRRKIREKLEKLREKGGVPKTSEKKEEELPSVE